MILQIDRGNTRLKWRLCSASREVMRGAFLNDEGYFSLATTLSDWSIQQIIVVSVLGEASDQAFSAWATKQFGVTPRFAKTALQCAGVTNGYRVPERLGVDRWLAMLGGYSRARGACVVVDCGSAITVDMIDQHGVHQGGYISPGITAMYRSLFANTHGVKVVKGNDVDDLSPGRDTESAVSSAQLIMITGLIQRAVQQLSIDGESASLPELLMTGGDGLQLSKFLSRSVFVPDLVFEGLELAFPAS